MKTRWYASDLHVGNRSDYSSIHAMLKRARKEALSLDLLGDVFELIFATWDEINRSPHKEVIDNLRTTAERIPVRILKGNHDLRLKDYADELAPVTVLNSPMIETDMYLSHGWEFDLNIRMFHRLHWWLAMKCPALMHIITTTPGLMKQSDKEQWGKYIDKIHSAFWNDLINAGYRFGIMGHTHSPQEWHHPTLDVHLYDVGDLIDSNTVLIWDMPPRFEVIK